MSKSTKDERQARIEKMLEPSRQTLYRMFNSERELLYVGITNNLFGRFAGHSGDKEWFHEIAYATFKHYPNRREVDKAETAAIRRENPKYNRAKNPAYEGAVDHYRKLKGALVNGAIPEGHEEIIKTAKVITSTMKKDVTIPAALLLAMKGKTADCALCQQLEKNRAYNRLAQQASNSVGRRFGYN